MASAFTCASLGIQPTVRHADYIGAWLEVLRADEIAAQLGISEDAANEELVLNLQMIGRSVRRQKRKGW